MKRSASETRPINPPPATNSGRGELPAYLSNGAIGLRVRDIPLRAGLAVVAGLSGEHPVAHVEAAATAPYPVAGDVQVGRVWLSDALQCARFVRQEYDFSAGELHTELSFAVDGVEARLEILTFCSRTRPTLVVQQLQIEVSAACDVTLRASIDPAGVHGRWLRREVGTPGEESPAVDGAMHWETLGGLSTCGVAYVTELLGVDAAERTRAEWGEQSPLTTDYRFRARAGRKVRLRQIASLVPSQSHHRPDDEARRLAAFASTLGFDTLRSENKAAWDELWKGRILIHGADARWQALADAAFYYLNASVHPSSPSSTSIFGLAQWYDYHYCYGHIMWDVEAFSIPPLLLLQPDAARAMLDYRSPVVPAARANAKLNGRRGIQFPWESGMALGEESSPGPGSGSWREDHVSLDVAMAFAQYAHATADTSFLREQAWPVLQGVVERLASRVTSTKRGFEIHRMMGIAERQEPSNNDAFTAMAAKTVLAEAVACARALGYEVPGRWEDLAARLVIPMDRRGRAIQTHDPATATLVTRGTSPTPLGHKQHALGLHLLPVANGGRMVEVYETGVPRRAARVDRDAQEVRGIRVGLGIRSDISVPLIVEGERRGVLSAVSTSAAFFTERDAQFLATVSRWVGVVAYRAELSRLAETEAGARAGGRLRNNSSRSWHTTSVTCLPRFEAG